MVEALEFLQVCTLDQTSEGFQCTIYAEAVLALELDAGFVPTWLLAVRWDLIRVAN